MMTTVVDRWGNSLGVRLPKLIAAAVGLSEGDRVTIDVENGAVIVRRAKPKYTLEELLDGMTPKNVHPEIDWGPPVGKEIW